MKYVIHIRDRTSADERAGAIAAVHCRAEKIVQLAVRTQILRLGGHCASNRSRSRKNAHSPRANASGGAPQVRVAPLRIRCHPFAAANVQVHSRCLEPQGFHEHQRCTSQRQACPKTVVSKLRGRTAARLDRPACHLTSVHDRLFINSSSSCRQFPHKPNGVEDRSSRESAAFLVYATACLVYNLLGWYWITGKST
jgi:hypothetical protein